MNGQNHLARNSQVQAARARLAQRNVPGRNVPGGAARANMAGCGDDTSCEPFDRQGYPPGTIVQKNTVCNIIGQTVAGNSVTIETFMRGGGSFFACGISSCNNCFEVIINSIRTGSIELNVLACPNVDAGMFNTDDCWCSLEIGCFNSISPLEVEFSAFANPSILPFINLGIWGDAIRSWGDCGGWLPYGMPARLP